MYVSPKTIVASMVFTSVNYMKLNNKTYQTGVFSLLYYLISYYLVGYNTNWREVLAATVVCYGTLMTPLDIYQKVLVFLVILSLLRPLCQIK